jgi:RNA 2',3'-cyclic 3'-phosphodiesterase
MCRRESTPLVVAIGRAHRRRTTCRRYPRAVIRLFIAVWPPEEVAEELRALRRKDQRGVRFVDPDTWHVTLRFVGDADPDLVGAFLDGLALPSATARIGPGVDLLGERALVVPVHGLDELADAVRSATSGLGEPAPKRFVGHLTLARLKPGAHLPAALGAFISAEFEVEDIALVASRLHPDGARYTTLATWPVSRR